jgi:hypothetical protein
VEKKLEGFNNKLKFDKLNYPQCSCGKCPRFYWNMMNIGSRGNGKTYTICQMIKHYEKYKIMKDDTEYKLCTHLISPTIQANEIYQSLDSLDMEKDAHDDYNDKLLLNIIEDIKTEKKEYDKYLLYKKYYEKFMKTPESKLEKLYDEEPEIFHLLEEYGYIHPKDFKHEPPKVNVVILDDLLGSDALILSHYLDEFEELYDFATDKPFGSLIIDTTNGKRFLSNLDSELFIQNKNVV